MLPPLMVTFLVDSAIQYGVEKTPTPLKYQSKRPEEERTQKPAQAAARKTCPAMTGTLAVR